MDDVDLIEAFLDAIREQRDAEEFERLTIGPATRRTFDESMASIETCTDLLDAGHLLWDDRSALDDLKGRRALEQLQARFRELWEQVVMSEAVNAA